MILRVLILLLIPLRLSAQQFTPAAYLGMGGAGLGESGIFSLAYNPVGLARISSATVAIAYQQHFVGTDISTQAAMLGLPIDHDAALGLNLVNYGVFELSSFVRAGLSYSKAYGNRITASLTTNYHLYSVKKYQSEKAFSADLGFKYKWTDLFYTALLFKNVSDSGFGSTVDERLEREIGLGFLYLIGEDVRMVADVVKAFSQELLYRAGVCYFFDPKFCFRTGASSGPLRYTAGCGFRDNRWTIDFAFGYHTHLNLSPQLAMSYVF